MNVPLEELLKASYKPQREAKKDLSKYGYSYDPELSTMETKVFLDPQGNPVVTHRGSKRVSDWVANNALLAVGLEKYAPRFKEAERTTKKIKEKYQGKPITQTGHSLGGAIAESQKGEKTYTYQKGSGISSIGKSLPSSQVDIRTKYDLPSALSQFNIGGKKIELQGSLNPLKTHEISQIPSETIFV